MDLIELAREIGLNPKRIAATGGGEYHSACPKCGGVDRFMIWKGRERYWCRQCELKGDAIQFCRDMLGLSYQEACQKLNVPTREKAMSRTAALPSMTFDAAVYPSVLWQEKATNFVECCHQQLLLDPTMMAAVHSRGLTTDSVIKFKLGYCHQPFWCDREAWGLPPECKSDGKPRRIWLPHGIVIPTHSDDYKVIKLKIRRQDWRAEDTLPKYVEVSGSMKCPAIFGDIHIAPPIILESEFDAMLVHQLAADISSCIAIGGAGKKPDLETHQKLLKCPKILFALDFDEAGKKAFNFWRSTYSRLRAWPVPKTKGPGDAHKAGIDIRSWVAAGIKELY